MKNCDIGKLMLEITFEEIYHLTFFKTELDFVVILACDSSPLDWRTREPYHQVLPETNPYKHSMKYQLRLFVSIFQFIVVIIHFLPKAGRSVSTGSHLAILHVLNTFCECGVCY